MIPYIGNSVPLNKTLTSPEVEAPNIIWMPPNNAEALPAFFEKGSIASAREFGVVKPRLNMYMNKRESITMRGNNPVIIPGMRNAIAANWTPQKNIIIFSISNFFITIRFNWLPAT